MIESGSWRDQRCQDLFADKDLRPTAKSLTVFRAELLGSDEATWQELFEGFATLKAITLPRSLEFLLQFADGFSDMEIVFGSGSILCREPPGPGPTRFVSVPHAHLSIEPEMGQSRW